MTNSKPNKPSDGIPPWQDLPTLAWHISCSITTVENWVNNRTLPPGRRRSGKLMWKWAEVDAWLTNGPQDGLADQPTEMTDAVRRARETDRHARF